MIHTQVILGLHYSYMNNIISLLVLIICCNIIGSLISHIYTSLVHYNRGVNCVSFIIVTIFSLHNYN